MRNYGYRVKINPNFLTNFFAFYKEHLNSLEIKLTNDMLHASCMEHIIKISKTYDFAHLSFHAPKKAFYMEEDCKSFLLFLNSKNEFNENIFVTHFYLNIPYKVDYITSLVKKANERKVKLAIENVEVENGLFNYLMQLKKFAIQYNINVCIDIGHLLYSSNKCNIQNKDLILFFEKDKWWFENVIEIHMHDFNNSNCHLNIGKGITNFDDVTHLIATFETSCPIILETTVNDLSTQGVYEILTLKERIHENADN